MSGDSLEFADGGRYAELDLDGDDVIVYDRTRTQAWIQSDLTVPTGAPTDDESEAERRRERRLAAAHAERPGNGGDSE